jgi:uncharacterized protein (UPF0303 family)
MKLILAGRVQVMTQEFFIISLFHVSNFEQNSDTLVFITVLINFINRDVIKESL